MRKEPSRFETAFNTITGNMDRNLQEFHDGAAWLPIRSHLKAQAIVDTFKEYLNATNREYGKRVEIKLRQIEEAERAELKKKLEEERRRQQILSTTNI